MSQKMILIATSLVIGGLLSGCAPSSPVEAAAPTSQPSMPSADPTPETPEPDGSRDLPWPTGLAVQYDNTSVWTFTFGPTAVDQYSAIAANDEFAEAPADGSMYITAPVTVQIADNEQTAAGGDPWASMDITYVSASGNTAQECLSELPAPGDLYAVGTMYGGASADFLACAIVPVDDVSGGTWAVRSVIEPDMVTFIVGAE
jgi:hypothetical protein